MELIEKYGFLVLGWIAFGMLHSFMASSKIKNTLGFSDLNYRRLYNLQSVIIVMALLLYGSTILPDYFLENGKANKAIGLMLATFGYLLLKLAFKQMSLAAFLGFKPEGKAELITTGIYERVRHPLYTATVLVVLGFLIFSPTYTNVVHAICVISYVFVGAYFEEKRLVKRFGKAYVAYKKETPFIVPKINNK